jgi:hypothetical protein
MNPNKENLNELQVSSQDIAAFGSDIDRGFCSLCPEPAGGAEP